MRIPLVLSTICVLLAELGQSAEPIDLIPAQSALDVWGFNNGREFPGATGGLEIDPQESHREKPSLRLTGDFTGGGGYVQAGRKLDAIDVRELSFWIKAEAVEQCTLRLGDSRGQTHQIKLRISPEPGWKKVVLPLEEFFKHRGKSNAVTGISDYEYWGGPNDGNWHGPATALYLLLANGGENTVRRLWLSDIQITPKSQPIAGAEQVFEVPLSEIVEGIHDWRFTNGPEFKGASGSLKADGEALLLSGDFTQGGAYVAAIRDLEGIGAAAVPAIRMRLKSDTAHSLSVQLVDATGQTHQRKALKVNADGEWHDFELIPSEIAGGEHWGGAADGRWHDPPSKMVLSITTRSHAGNQPKLMLSDVRAEAVFPVFAEPAAFAINEAIVLSRSLAQINEPRSSLSEKFLASPGQWQVSLAYHADLHSPDNSYRGTLHLEALGKNDEILESIPVADVFGKHKSTPLKTKVELPENTVAARFRTGLNKAHGEFAVEELAASFLAPAPRRNDRIERLLFSSAQLGNLLFPEDSRVFGITAETRKPLSDSQKTIRYVVRDYWGAEQMQAADLVLGAPKKTDKHFVYQASLDLGAVPLENGRYYELHAEIISESNSGIPIEPFCNHTSFAILPEASTKKYDPMDVPFTARNWDNRIAEYIRLTDRLGIRVCGLWGGWSPKPPYKPTAPGLKLCRELGMGWLTTTPIKHIERGKDDEWTEEALRQGVRNFLETYGNERPLVINLGNEPHGTGERVRKNVEAYRMVYEEIKTIDPGIPVVATSVEPNEEYFKNGYGQWCDAYDFHIYEHHTKVRQTMERYRQLMAEHDVVKPIWSTELGLNSQGQPRHAVSLEVIKKFATFFAAGGENVSWFGLLYPDPEGKSHGSSGDSHNVFDCRFKRYAPRLDAVTLYHAINAIGIKKFVAEKTYPNGVVAFLFRDRNGQCLQILWKPKGRADVFVPLPDVETVKLTHLDGSHAELDAKGDGLTLGISQDPLMLLYTNNANALSESLGPPTVKFANTPVTTPRNKPAEIILSSPSVDADNITISAPPFWAVNHDGLRFTVTPPAKTSAREAEFTVTLADGQGEIRLRLPIED